MCDSMLEFRKPHTQFCRRNVFLELAISRVYCFCFSSTLYTQLNTPKSAPREKRRRKKTYRKYYEWCGMWMLLFSLRFGVQHRRICNNTLFSTKYMCACTFVCWATGHWPHMRISFGQTWQKRKKNESRFENSINWITLQTVGNLLHPFGMR